MKSENDWIERLVPVALTGPLREKALDATRLALTIFHMSPDDVAGAIGQAAQIRGVAVDSPKAWIKFYRDMAGQMDVVGKKVVDSRLRAIGNGLGYSSAETKALHLLGLKLADHAVMGGVQPILRARGKVFTRIILASDSLECVFVFMPTRPLPGRPRSFENCLFRLAVPRWSRSTRDEGQDDPAACSNTPDW